MGPEPQGSVPARERTASRKGLWIAIGAVSLVVLLCFSVFMVTLSGGGRIDDAATMVLGVLMVFGVPVASAVITAWCARRLGRGYPLLWGILGFMFPVVALVLVLIVSAMVRNRAAHGGSPRYLGADGYAPPPTRPRTRICAYCGSEIDAADDNCPNCAGRGTPAG